MENGSDKSKVGEDRQGWDHRRQPTPLVRAQQVGFQFVGGNSNCLNVQERRGWFVDIGSFSAGYHFRTHNLLNIIKHQQVTMTYYELVS